MKKLLLLILSLSFSAAALSSCSVSSILGKIPGMESSSSSSNEPVEETYTITFKQEGQSDVVKTVKEGESLAATDIPALVAKVGYDVAWDKTSADLANVKGDITVTAIATAKQYTISLNPDGGTLSQTSAVVTYDAAASLPTPTKDGYTFLGWQHNGKDINLEKWNIAENVTLIASWSKNAPKMYKVTFIQEGQAPLVYDAEEKTAFTFRPIPVQEEGYEPIEWRASDLSLLDYVTSDIKVYANAKKAIEYTATVKKADGTDVVIPYTIENRTEKLATISAMLPSVTGYTYAWKSPLPTELPLANGKVYTITEVANEYKITYDVAGGTLDSTEQKVVYGAAYTLATPSKVGYTFAGWTHNGESFVAGSAWSYAQDITLTATWTAKTYTVSFTGTDSPVASITVTYGQKVSNLPDVPAKTGYEIGVWKIGDRVINKDTVWDYAENKELTADYGNKIEYTLSFSSTEGTCADITVTYGDTLTNLPEVPEKAGYTGVWKIGDIEITKESTWGYIANETAVADYTANMTRYSVNHWLENLDGGYARTEDWDAKTGLTDTLTNAEVKTYEGFTAQPITQKNIDGDGSTVVDVYYDRNTYDIVFLDNGGTFKNTISPDMIDAKYGTSIAEPEIAKTGYSLEGWYIADVDGNMDLSQKYTFGGTVNSDLILKANWTIDTYYITFTNEQGETVPNGKVPFTIETESITVPAVPTKTGYDGSWGAYDLNTLENQTVAPVYTATVYTVTFYKEDGETLVDTKTYTIKDVENGTLFTAPEVPDKAGYTKAWETYDCSQLGNKTVKPVYSIITYKAQFLYEDGSVYKEVEYNVNTNSITAPVVPAKAENNEHYNATWEEYTLTLGGVEVEPVYTAKVYTIEFYANGAKVGETISYTFENYDEVVSAPTSVPDKPHYSGVWPSFTPAYNTEQKINAVYTALEYTVTFKADGKVVKITDNKYTVENKQIDVPSVPVKDHYTGDWESYTLDGGDKEINAVYTAVVYNITFIADNTQISKDTYSLDNKEISEPSVPVKNHYTGKWESYTLDGGDKIVKAVYTPIEYTVKFMADGVEVSGECDNTYTIEDKSITPPTVPTKEHYTGSWISGSYDVTNEDGSLKGSFGVNANYVANEYSIKFVGANGNEVANYTYTIETLEDAPITTPDYTKKGYTVTWPAWTLGYSKDQVVTANEVPNPYKVSFVGGVEEVSPVYATFDEQFTNLPEVPHQDGYVGVWKLDTNGNGQAEADEPIVNKQSKWTIDSDTTLYAYYGEPVDYTLTIKKADGSTETKSVTWGSAILEQLPQVTSKAHYNGVWKLDLGTSGDTSDDIVITDDTVWSAESDLTAYEYHTPIEYTITFNSHNKTDKVTYSIENQTIAEPIPVSMEHHDQTDPTWETYSIVDGEGNFVGGNIEVDAIYTPNTYTIKFVDENDATIEEVTYTYGATSINEPAVPVKKGYTVMWPNNYTLDGNDTVKANYVPIEYTITFQVDENVVYTQKYTVETDKSAIVVPANPTKQHHTSGWPDFTLAIGGTEVVAIFTPNTYTIEFYDWKGNLVGSDDYTYGKEDTTFIVPDSVKNLVADEGYEITWPTYTFDGNKQVTANHNLITYTITFYKAETGEDVLGTQTFNVTDKDITIPGVPSREGYDGDWSPYSTDTLENQEVRPVYTAHQYTVKFMADGKTIDTQYYTVENRNITEPTVPVKEHYDSLGWAGYDISTGIGDKVVEAKYKATEYTVKFVADGVEVSSTDNIYTIEDATISKPTIPTKTHYTQTAPYWDNDYTLSYDKDVVVVIEAIYTPNTYTITFVDKDNNTVTNGVVNYTYGATSIQVPAVPVETGYTVTWPTNYTLDRDNTVKANYVANTYNVTYDLAYGDNSSTEYTNDATYGQDYEITLDDPVRAGYTFNGWALNGNTGTLYKKGDQVSAWNIADHTAVFTADWTANPDTAYKVEYYQQNLDGNGYTLVETEDLTGTTDTTATATKKSYVGFEFISNSNDNVLSGTIAGDASLVLKVYYNRITYTLTFKESKDATDSTTEDVMYGNSITTIAPSKYGYSFTAWVDEAGNTWDGHSKTTLYPSYNPIVYTASVTKFGETESTSIAYTIEDRATILAGLISTGYKLVDVTDNEEVAVTELPLANDKIYKVIAKTYTITYNVNGGTLPDDANTTLTYGEAYTLPTPTKEADATYTYTFVEWTYNGEPVDLTNGWSIDEADGTIELVAKWTATEIPVDDDGDWTQNY